MCVRLHIALLCFYILASIRHSTVKAVDVGRVVAVVVAVTDASSRPHFTLAKCY